jgi:hypothetical protein
MPIPSKDQHKNQVLAFLEQRISPGDWQIAQPRYGTGHESYLASSGERRVFVKLGVQVGRTQIAAELGLTPRVIVAGYLEDGVSILVQEQIDGQMPARQDFYRLSESFAQTLRKTHHSPALKSSLLQKAYDSYKDAGLECLAQVQARWEIFKAQVPAQAGFVDESIARLAGQIEQFQGGGLAASHNDPCNGNWLVTEADQVYLLDFESMSLDDPALDLGAFLWWYYPPARRGAFLETAGAGDDDDFRQRMRLRMALHCLNIILPRPNSFDRFKAQAFEDELEDFRAIFAGQENPQGYL